MTTESIVIEVSHEVIDNALASAFDSGIAYWARVEDEYRPKGAEDCWLSEVVTRGGWVQLKLLPGDTGRQPRRLTLGNVREGLRMMAAWYPGPFGALLGGTGDSTTGDILLQLSVFGEVIYG